MSRCRTYAYAVIPLLHLCISTNASGQAVFSEINSNVNAISDDGSTVVGNSYPQGVRWTSTMGLVVLEGTYNATAVSANGCVIVGNDSSNQRAIRWTEQTGAVDIGTLGGLSSARGVSGDGTVVVGFSDGPAGRESFRWTELGGMQGLGFPPTTGPPSRAPGISADGTIIVGSVTVSLASHAFRWTEATGLVDIGNIGTFTYAQEISADGSTIVGGAGGGVHGWFWTEADGFTVLGAPSEAVGVSGDGSVIVGGLTAGAGPPSAYIWDEANGVRDLKTVLENDFALDLTGWTLYAALDISADARTIAGWGINPMGNSKGWIAALDGFVAPEPCEPLPRVPTISMRGMILLVALLSVAGAWMLRVQCLRQRTELATHRRSKGVGSI